jgi:aryl-alcohol dehydrogenase-like predicted oxidoreductase
MGTMTFGSQADIVASRFMVERCLENGINFFDTANVYNQGRSEEILGEILGPRRGRVVLASKVRGKMETPQPHAGLSRKAMRLSLEYTLQRLKTDYLDIYYLHQPDYETPVEETLETLEDLRREGKIRHGATSNYSAWQLCEIFWLCEKNGWKPPYIAQPMYNVLARGIEQEYVSFTRRFSISNICYNPLAGGLLTGKHSRHQDPLPGTRFDGNQMYLSRYWHESYFEAVAALEKISVEAGLNLLQLAFRWLLSRQDVQSVIVGASRIEQLEANLEAANGKPLPEDVLRACDNVWEGLRGPAPRYNR